MGLSADHITKLGLSVGQPVMVVKGGKKIPGHYRAFAYDTAYVEHYTPPIEPKGNSGVVTCMYKCGELDDIYPIEEGPLNSPQILRWIDDPDDAVELVKAHRRGDF